MISSTTHILWEYVSWPIEFENLIIFEILDELIMSLFYIYCEIFILMRHIMVYENMRKWINTILFRKKMWHLTYITSHAEVESWCDIEILRLIYGLWVSMGLSLEARGLARCILLRIHYQLNYVVKISQEKFRIFWSYGELKEDL